MKKRRVKKVQCTIYLDKYLADCIKEEASKTNQSMNNIISMFLKEMWNYTDPRSIIQKHLKIIEKCVIELQIDHDIECESILDDIMGRGLLGEQEENLSDLKEQLKKKESRKSTYKQILSSLEIINEKIELI